MEEPHMGKPSDKRRSARRPGSRERARVKKPARTECSANVGGAGTYAVKAGRKKYRKVVDYCDRVVKTHQACDSLTSKSGGKIERPLYKIKLRPLLSFEEVAE